MVEFASRGQGLLQGLQGGYNIGSQIAQQQQQKRQQEWQNDLTKISTVFQLAQSSSVDDNQASKLMNSIVPNINRWAGIDLGKIEPRDVPQLKPFIKYSEKVYGDVSSGKIKMEVGRNLIISKASEYLAGKQRVAEGDKMAIKMTSEMFEPDDKGRSGGAGDGPTPTKLKGQIISKYLNGSPLTPQEKQYIASDLRDPNLTAAIGEYNKILKNMGASEEQRIAGIQRIYDDFKLMSGTETGRGATSENSNSFASEEEARKAGKKSGDKVIIGGVPGTLN